MSEPTLVGLMSFAVYIAGGWLLAFHYNSINGDALSRVANAGYVMFSRDPHLAAVGFVWNPLPSALEMPILLLHGWMPWLISRGFAGDIMSATTGGLAVWALAGLLHDEGVPRAPRLLLIIAFALHPIVLYAGANGMSEAPYLCFLLLGARYLLRWTRTRSVRSLVISGVALGIGYYTRYEVILAAVSAIGLVLLIAFWRATGSARNRARSAVMDGCVIAAPVVFAFTTWAVVSWVIVGSPFAQFTSQYGNSSQLALGAGGTPGGRGLRLQYVTHQITLLGPLLVLAVVVALGFAVARRDVGALVPVAIFGSILVFEVAAFLRGQTASWLRYYIVEIPLVVALAGSILVGRREEGTAATTGDRPPALPPRRVAGAVVLGAVAVGLAVAGVVSSVGMVNSPNLAREETDQLQAIFYKNSPHAAVLKRLATERQIASYIAGLKLPHGAVLMDVARAFTIWTQSPHPKVFLITPDRDFQPAAQDPAGFHVEYLLAEPNSGLGSVDELNRLYPTLYQDGAEIATLVRQFDSTSDLGPWRLYKLNESVAAPPTTAR